MSDRAIVFLTEWARDNLLSDMTEQDAEHCRELLLADAHELGMGLGEFEEEVGNIDAYLARALRDHPNDRFREIGESGVADT